MSSENGRCVPLESWIRQKHEAVRERIREAGCAFQFEVLALPESCGEPGDADHRQVLQQLFEALRAQYAGLRFYPELAESSPWDSECVTNPADFLPGLQISEGRNLNEVTMYEWLFQAFDNPPYKAKCGQGLFADFCEATGLWPSTGIQVLDWVGDPDENPGRSEWSNYFDAGKEWWGIWCLTVWNPKKRTLAALAASETD